MKSTFLFFCFLISGAICAAEPEAVAETAEAARDGWKILAPAVEMGETYRVAAKEFQKYYALVTGETLEIVTEGKAGENYVVIGSDAVNGWVRGLVERHVLDDFPLKISSDDYRILSVQDGENAHLILAGGRGRSTLYAVYDFFERRAGCRWFWDGDVVPQAASVDMTGLDVTESPRFAYRGLRYFAHRGLTRFQAEHWGLEDWKREIDWMAKKRLNVFMLRIGIDDLFQKAFPDIVCYPDASKTLPEALAGYDNRSLFWSLEYRGKLRKAVLAYAFERDLMHPEDFGTMTHWYSRTPKDFLEAKKPAFLPQVTNWYQEPTALVWDIRKDANLADYWKLTETHIREYGRPELFHTIGLAERHCYHDRAENLRLKLYTYRRLIQNLRQHYPTGQLLLAGWDFYHSWTPEEVRAFFQQLDPNNTILWDYEADALGENHLLNWDVVGKFPYVFGIFLAFESALDIRGRYDIIEPRIEKVKDDPFCRGCILWPESSHTDIFMLHYFTQTAWQPGEKSLEALLQDFCAQRYGSQAEKLGVIWRDVLPISQLLHWDGSFWRFGHQMLTGFMPLANRAAWQNASAQQIPVLRTAPEIYRRLAEVAWSDDFVRRDTVDLARTVTDRLLTCVRVTLVAQMYLWKDGKLPAETVRKTAACYEKLLDEMATLLALHEDYSLAESLERLDQIEKIQNPHFDRVLLENASCEYCFSHQYELVANWYVPSLKTLCAWAVDRLNRDDKSDFSQPPAFAETLSARRQKTLNTPLLEMRPTLERSPENFRQCMTRLAEISGNFLVFCRIHDIDDPNRDTEY